MPLAADILQSLLLLLLLVVVGLLTDWLQTNVLYPQGSRSASNQTNFATQVLLLVASVPTEKLGRARSIYSAELVGSGRENE